MPALTNSRGADTGALYGMMTIILPKLEQLSPLYAAVAYDLKAPTFRHKLFDEYKADRKPMPPELFAQLPVSKALMSELGLYVCELEGLRLTICSEPWRAWASLQACMYIC